MSYTSNPPPSHSLPHPARRDRQKGRKIEKSHITHSTRSSQRWQEMGDWGLSEPCAVSWHLKGRLKWHYIQFTNQSTKYHNTPEWIQSICTSYIHFVYIYDEITKWIYTEEMWIPWYSVQKLLYVCEKCTQTIITYGQRWHDQRPRPI